jgi:hypothetical protein
MLLDRGQTAYTFLNRLCSAEWYGGSPKGNAGLVCKRQPNSECLLEVADFLAQYVYPQSHYHQERCRVLTNIDLPCSPSLSRHNRHQPARGAAVEASCRRACRCHKDHDGDRPLPVSTDLGTLGVGRWTTAFFPQGGGANFRVGSREGSNIGTVAFSAADGREGGAQQSCQSDSDGQCSEADLESFNSRPSYQSPAAPRASVRWNLYRIQGLCIYGGRRLPLQSHALSGSSSGIRSRPVLSHLSTNLFYVYWPRCQPRGSEAET